jgi:hypothetical protein
MNPGEVPVTPPNLFLQEIRKLPGQKARFYVGGGERGYLQGPVVKVEGNFLYIEKEGPIRGTIQTISMNAEFIHYYEIDKLVQ